MAYRNVRANRWVFGLVGAVVLSATGVACVHGDEDCVDRAERDCVSPTCQRIEGYVITGEGVNETYSPITYAGCGDVADVCPERVTRAKDEAGNLWEFETDCVPGERFERVSFTPGDTTGNDAEETTGATE